jgi:hypothetical protein
VCPEE